MNRTTRQWWPWVVAALWMAWACCPLWAQESVAADPAEPLDWLSDIIQRRGIGWALPAVFLGGLALNLTPCVYPMIPVTMAFFSSQAAEMRGRRTALLAICYVLGISLNYAVLGMIAAKTGLLFGAWLQQPAVLIGIVLVIVALSLSMFGLYDLRMPQVVTRRLGTASTGLGGAFLMGLVVGLVAAPCIGPFVLGLLLLVGKLANPATGFLLFLVLGLGMGTPYLVLGMATHRVGHLPKAGPWMVWTKKLLGVVLLGLALYFLNPLLPAAVVSLAVVALLAGAGAYLGFFDRTRGRGTRFVWVQRLVGGALVLAAVTVAWPKPEPAALVTWVPYSEAALEEAQRAQRPILIDIYADWCLPCVEMEHVTFRRAEVVEALIPVATLRVDATREVTEDAEQLLQRHKIYGAPTILFFDKAGRERTDLRLTGFVNAEQFLERLEQIL